MSEQLETKEEMSTNEATSFNTLKANVFKSYDRVDRIENITLVPGMPDFNATLDGRDVWIEIKTPKNVPVRSSTALLCGNHQLSIEQRNWQLRHARAGGRGFIYIDAPSRRYLIWGKGADLVNVSTPVELMMMAAWTAPVPTTVERWKELRGVLIGR